MTSVALPVIHLYIALHPFAYHTMPTSLFAHALILIRTSQGIWSRKPALISALGDDMSGVLKVAPPETSLTSAAAAAAGGIAPTSTVDYYGDVASPLRLPTGLKNLGATCYLNSQLQALFANKSFRDGVFSWRPLAGAGAAGTSAPGVGGTMEDEGISSGGGGGAAGDAEVETASSELDDAIMRVSAKSENKYGVSMIVYFAADVFCTVYTVYTCMCGQSSRESVLRPCPTYLWSR